MKALWNQVGGRILLGDNRWHGVMPHWSGSSVLDFGG